jgi:hypothetical protein
MEQEAETGDTGTEFDVESAVEEIGAGLGLGMEETPDDPELEAVAPEAKETETPETPAAPVVREAPKSWAKETHEVWAKLPPEAQTQIELREKQILDGLDQYKTHAGFGKQMREAVAPFEQMIQQHGLDAPKAVQYLLSAHQRLTHGSPESRIAAYQQLGRDLGLDPNAPTPDPKYQALEQKVTKLESTLTERQQKELDETKAQIAKEVETFASDTKAHPYFEECADDIVRLCNAGYDLQQAYDTAVMANPVTRAKEEARIKTETEARLRENMRLDALKAKTAKGTNVRTRETTRAPTEPLGTMEDTMKETLAAINARTH